jgi:hypothetical protein
MDHGLQHQQSLSDANANLDSIITHGSGIMSGLKTQHFTLKVGQWVWSVGVVSGFNVVGCGQDVM